MKTEKNQKIHVRMSTFVLGSLGYTPSSRFSSRSRTCWTSVSKKVSHTLSNLPFFGGVLPARSLHPSAADEVLFAAADVARRRRLLRPNFLQKIQK